MEAKQDLNSSSFADLFLNKQKSLDITLLGLTFVCRDIDALTTLVEYTCDAHGIDPSSICCLTQRPFNLPGSKQTTGLSNSDRTVFISGPDVSTEAYKQRQVTLFSSFSNQKTAVLQTNLKSKDLKDSQSYRVEILNREVILSFLLGLQRSTELSKLVLNLLQDKNSLEASPMDVDSFEKALNTVKARIEQDLAGNEAEYTKLNQLSEQYTGRITVQLSTDTKTAAEKSALEAEIGETRKSLQLTQLQQSKISSVIFQNKERLEKIKTMEMPVEAEEQGSDYWQQYIEYNVGLSDFKPSTGFDLLPEKAFESAPLISCEKVLFVATFETGIVDQSQLEKQLKQQAYNQNAYNISISSKDRSSVRASFKDRSKQNAGFLMLGSPSQKETVIFKPVSIAGKNELVIQTLHYVQRKSAQNLFRHLSTKTNLGKIDLIPAGYLYELLDRVQRTPLFESFFQALEAKNAQQFKPSIMNEALRASEALLWVKRNWTSLKNFYVGQADADIEAGFTQTVLSKTNFRDQKIAVEYITEILPSLKAVLVSDPRFFEIIVELVLSLKQESPDAVQQLQERVPGFKAFMSDIEQKQLMTKVNSLKENLSSKSGTELAEIFNNILNSSIQGRDGTLTADILLIHIGALLSILIEASEKPFLPKTARVWIKGYSKGIPLTEKYWQDIKVINGLPNTSSADKWLKIKQLQSGKVLIEGLKKQFK